MVFVGIIPIFVFLEQSAKLDGMNGLIGVHGTLCQSWQAQCKTYNDYNQTQDKKITVYLF